MTCGRRGEAGKLAFSLEGELREEPFPKSFLEAMLSARFKAFVAALDATLEGDEDKEGGAYGRGCGGNVMLFVFAESVLGDGCKSPFTPSEGTRASWSGFRVGNLISALELVSRRDTRPMHSPSTI